MHKAKPIKQWIIDELTPKAWSSVISKALPDLINYNSSFNCFGINKRTLWDQTEIKIIQYHLERTYSITIPYEIMNPKSNADLVKDWVYRKSRNI